MKSFFKLVGAVALAVGLASCGGGGGDAGTPPFGGGPNPPPGGGTPVPAASMTIAISNTTVTGATPATVTARVVDAQNRAIPGVVVQFTTAAGMGRLSAPSALTDGEGNASVTLAQSGTATAGADNVVATANVNGVTLTRQTGFQMTATSIAFSSLTADIGSSPLSPYGQAVLTANLTGVSESTPASLTFTSACVASGQATISPSSVTTTNGSFTLTYKDTGGCGAVRSSDTITASLAGSGQQRQLTLQLTSPAANTIEFVTASPETIYLKGSGYAESSTVTFRVVDSSGNPLPNQQVQMGLTTFAGGLTINSGQTTVTQTTDSNGRVTAIVNSGTVPTPVRVTASLGSGISTVSNNLAVAVGLPSQLNFSMSQTAANIEGANIDGTTNAYTLRAADRSGNPVPNGTPVVFWAEGGQIVASSQTQTVSGIAQATANFQAAEPRPADGRVTVLAYALGEESFVDLNGNNVFDSNEPFQDLGDIVKDKLFDSRYDSVFDEFVTLEGTAAGSQACADFTATYQQFALNSTLPNRPGTCSGTWSQRTYVRRSIETVLSTSNARLLWGNVTNITRACSPSTVTLQTGPYVTNTGSFSLVCGSGDVKNPAGKLGTLSFIIADNNTFPTGYTNRGLDGSGNLVTMTPTVGINGLLGRLNPMAAGTTISATGSTGLSTRVVGGSPVVSTTEATFGAVEYEFDDTTTSGTVTVNIRSPGGTTTTYQIGVVR